MLPAALLSGAAAKARGSLEPRLRTLRAHPAESLEADMPRWLLRLEGAVVFLGSTYLFWQSGTSWLVYILLILAPDLSMIGYAAGARAGALIYNLFHTYVAPLGLLAIASLMGAPVVEAVALIWLAHLGADRTVGFGLKYPSAFGDTHLARV